MRNELISAAQEDFQVVLPPNLPKSNIVQDIAQAVVLETKGRIDSPSSDIENFTPGSFEYIESLIRQAETTKQLGDRFEWLVKYFLENAPQYRGLFKKIWFWDEWPGRFGPDDGIDLVAETTDGELYAIQAKGYDSSVSITKASIDSFVSQSTHPSFDRMLLVGSTDSVSANALRTVQHNPKPFEYVLRTSLLNTDMQWPTVIGSNEVAPVERHEVREHQVEAVEKVTSGFEERDRGKLIMACGTGKTFVSQCVHEEMKSKRTLVLMPSLSLIAQTVSAWGKHGREPFQRLIVCSDQTIDRHEEEDFLDIKPSESGLGVTTDPNKIRQRLSAKGDMPLVVFSTYHSSPMIAEAMSNDGTEPFDLVLADEAHRCTGSTDKMFTTVLDDQKIPARKRLFMTATPKYYTQRTRDAAEAMDFELASMDDEELYGPEFHSLSFREAIERKLLSDYQVIIMGVTQSEIQTMIQEGRLVDTDNDGHVTDALTLAKQVAVLKAIEQYNLSKVITFHSNTKRADRFANSDSKCSLLGVANQLESPIADNLWTRSVNYRTPVARRTGLIREFSTMNRDCTAVLSNPSCLGEGIDAPLDAIALIDKKNSMIDVVQSTGRVIRKDREDKTGYVIIPVFIDEQADPKEALSSSSYNHVWQILKALRSHDETFAMTTDKVRVNKPDGGDGGGGGDGGIDIVIDIPTKIELQDFAESLSLKTLSCLSERPDLTIDKILEWADAYYQRTGKKPTERSGKIPGTNGEKWVNIDRVLRKGLRGLPGGSSLAQILSIHRSYAEMKDKPSITIESILQWADAYYQRTGKWPTSRSGEIPGTNGEKWSAINAALYNGARGLPGGSSLAQVLSEHRDLPIENSGEIPEASGMKCKSIDGALRTGGRGLPSGSSLPQVLSEHRDHVNSKNKPDLTIDKILEWADAYYQRTGKKPTERSGKIPGTNGEKWVNIDRVLRKGLRGLPGGSSLAQILSIHRSYAEMKDKPSITIESILQWADAYYQRTGKWPTSRSGEIPGTNGEKWSAINAALYNGARGLPGGSSLAQVLSEHRDLPIENSGEIPEASGMKCKSIDGALRTGGRGLPSGSSLPQVLSEHRDHVNSKNKPDLTIDKILEWADAYYQRTGKKPTERSGKIPGTNGEKWVNIDRVLRKGLRGLPGGSSLAQILSIHRSYAEMKDKPSITIESILQWADAYYQRTGKWPTSRSGEIPGTNGEKWSAINAALYNGARGLPGGSSLAQVLSEHRDLPIENSGEIPEASGMKCKSIDGALRTGGRGLPSGSSLPQVLSEHRDHVNSKNKPDLTIDKILEWADAYYQRTGKKPTERSGKIPGTNGEKWVNIDRVLRKGLRGLPGGSSLAQILSIHRSYAEMKDKPSITIESILQWADAYYQRTGKWPTSRSGEIPGTNGEKWSAINAALYNGARGLPGGSSLVKLLAEHRSYIHAK